MCGSTVRQTTMCSVRCVGQRSDIRAAYSWVARYVVAADHRPCRQYVNLCQWQKVDSRTTTTTTTTTDEQTAQLTARPPYWLQRATDWLTGSRRRDSTRSTVTTFQMNHFRRDRASPTSTPTLSTVQSSVIQHPKSEIHWSSLKTLPSFLNLRPPSKESWELNLPNSPAELNRYSSNTPLSTYFILWWYAPRLPLLRPTVLFLS